MAELMHRGDTRALGLASRRAGHKVLVGMTWLIATFLMLAGRSSAQGAEYNDEASVDYINQYGGTWGSDGAQFKEELNQGNSLICYESGLEDETGHSAESGYLLDGITWVVFIDTKYYGDGFKLMQFILHEMKHRSLHPGEPPEDPVKIACEEAEADCAAVEGIAAAAQAAAAAGGIPAGFCEGLLEFRNHFIEAWEKCNGDWFPGFPTGCPELGELILEVCL